MGKSNGFKVVISVLIGILIIIFVIATYKNSNYKYEDKEVIKEIEVRKEDLENFISLMVGYNNYSYNNLEEVADPNLVNDDHATFIRIIRMLYNDSKTDFYLKDINKYAKEYFNINNFNYDPKEELAFSYNKEEERYNITGSFGLFDEVYYYTKPVVTYFDVTDNKVNVKCSVNRNYNEIRETQNYKIVLSYYDNSYVVESISYD